jgi:hypothetical protein
VWATVFIQAILTVMARNHYTMDGKYFSNVFFFIFILFVWTVMARNHYTMDGDYCSKVFFFIFVQPSLLTNHYAIEGNYFSIFLFFVCWFFCVCLTVMACNQYTMDGNCF